MYARLSRFTNMQSSEVPYSIDGYEETFEDIAVASGNIDLTFNRYYNSADDSGNMLGSGWTASFEGSVNAYGENSVAVRIYGKSPLVFKAENGKYVCSYSRAALTSSNGGYVFTDEGGLKYNFNANGCLVKITDKNNNTVTINVDAGGKIQKVTDSEGTVTGYEYNSANNSVTVYKDNEVMEKRVYNRYNYPTSTETADGTQKNYYCNAYGDIAVTEGSDGAKTLYAYDSKGNSVKVTTVSDGKRETETGSYDSSGNLLKTVTSDGKTLGYNYNLKGDKIRTAENGTVKSRTV